MQKELLFEYEDKTYPVIITYKHIRRSYYRFKNNTFYISSSRLNSVKYLINNLHIFAPRLLKRSEKEKAITDRYFYLFGFRLSREYFTISDEELKMILKSILHEYIDKRMQYYESLMGINNPYHLSIRNMKTRYGTNSKKTHSISFALLLVHYSFAVIDSVIVHELAHHFVFNHQNDFYKIVYKYCRDYKQLHNKLRKGEYR